MGEAEPSATDERYNGCFGCGPDNPRGLRLEFVPSPAGPEAGELPGMQCRYVAPEELCGAPGVVHGGIQATLLDEVMGVTAHRCAQVGSDDLVTADFRLRYRRPVPAGQPLVVRARLVSQDDRDLHLEGEILGEGDEVLTRAESRWRRIPARSALRPGASTPGADRGSPG